MFVASTIGVQWGFPNIRRVGRLKKKAQKPLCPNQKLDTSLDFI